MSLHHGFSFYGNGLFCDPLTVNHGVTSWSHQALETASAEVTTKELITEVATEEARLYGMEVAMQARLPIRLVCT